MSEAAPSSPSGATDARRRRVLFIGEGSTLAHAARPLALAAALPPDRFEAIVAVPERYARWIAPHLASRPLPAQTPELFAARIASGRPVFSAPRLAAYAEHDLALIGEVAPDVVVGDFRLSLAASARKAGAPYISLSNAYWSPDRPLRALRPSVGQFRRWPPAAAEAAFRLLAPAVLRWHAGPVDQLMAAHGLPGIDGDLRRAFTEADLTLYADLPALHPDLPQSGRRRFLGPVAWEPPVALPAWWNEIPSGKPVAYLTLGSSGDVSHLGMIAGALQDAGLAVLAATAGRAALEGDGRTLFTADYLPGAQAAARADLVVCNGGAPTASQALLAGRPVLGVCANLDQFLNMRAVERFGAGVSVRADALSPRALGKALKRLRGTSFAEAAARLAASDPPDPAEVLVGAIEQLLGPADAGARR